MRIFVTAKTRAKKEYIKKIDSAHYYVAVSAIPENGRANKAIIKSLARYFEIETTRVSLISGTTNKNKVFHIE